MATYLGEKLHTNAALPALLPGARGAALLWQGAAAATGLVLGAGRGHGGCAAIAGGQTGRGRLGRVPGAGRGTGSSTFFRGGLCQSRTGGGHRHYGPAGGGGRLADAAFPVPGAARAVPVAGHRRCLPATVCPRAVGSGPGGSRSGRAVRRLFRHAGRNRRGQHRPGGSCHGGQPRAVLCGAGRGTGQLGRCLPLPRRTPALRGCVCGGLHAGRAGCARCRRCAAAVCGRGCGLDGGAGRA